MKKHLDLGCGLKPRNPYSAQFTYGCDIREINTSVEELGFVYKKPKVIPAKIDLDKQEEFRQQYNLLKNNLKSDEAIYFMDGVHPQNQTKSDYGWIKKGVLKNIPSFSGWKRKSILGALNLDNLNIISQDYKTINEDSVIDFLYIFSP